MAVLQTRRLEAKFPLRDGVVHALRGIDLDIATGEFFVLLGPSGCGKTTMLRSIAGLERPTAGDIRIDGHHIFDAQNGVFVPPDQRPIAMVFQSYAIWPHMDVFENIAFPLRRGRLKMAREAVEERVGEVLEMLGLDALAARPVITLSGGQQQRVALARALALQPRILLMDEPLSNLDFKLQVRLARPDARPHAPAQPDDDPRHPQPGGGPGDRRPHRRHVGGPASSRSAIRKPSTTVRRTSSSRASSAT